MSEHPFLDESSEARARDRVIEAVRMQDDALRIVFLDGSTLVISDDGQSCCEHRYMTCDDELTSWTGSKYLGFEVLGAPEPGVDRDRDDQEHEVQFLHVRTSSGTLTCETHNENNGYYGGFAVRATFKEIMT
jgi:hypothetical protein